MYTEIEDTLSRELRQVAEGIEVPAMPDLPVGSPSRPWWPTLLVAAALVLVALATVATLARLGSDSRPQPAPSPTPTPTEAVEPPTTDPPTVPYVVDGRLFVGGEQVSGEYYSVDGTSTGWVATRTGNTYAWGYDAQPNGIEGVLNQPPAVSPSGEYVGYVADEDGQGMLTGFDTDPAGEGFGLGVEIPLLVQGVASRAVAVTDDGAVIAGGADFQEVWRPLDGGTMTQLADTAPGQVVISATDAGLVVNEGEFESTTDGTQGSPYLAALTADGTFRRIADLPTHGLLEASTEWVAWVPPGVVEGDVLTYGELSVQRLDGSEPAVLTPPDGWDFVNADPVWEAEDHLVARVTGPDGGGMVRCSPALGECVLLDTP